MDKIDIFFQWFNRLGGRVPKIINDDLKDRFKDVPIQRGSLKQRAQYIKDRYNHRFKGDPLYGYPDISKIKFKPKNKKHDRRKNS
jgi:hypothetical protein